ncbi:hypothetical protein DV736_g2674, partial [Chaetothyriales sp. CBS 134916]
MADRSSRSDAKAPPKRPTTTPAAPRLSTASRSSPLPAPKAAPETSLSKPPVRSTATAIRKPPPPTTTQVSPAHTKRTSLASVEGKAASDDGMKDGLSAKPKRVSLAPTSASAIRASAATSLRASAIKAAPTGTGSRLSVRGPPSVGKSPVTPAPRTGIARPSQTRLSSSALPSSTTAADKQRLKTIPDSPSVAQPEHLEVDDNKENVDSGSKKSVRSVMLEQKLREVEFVKQLLERAVTDEVSDDAEAEDLSKKLSDVEEGILASLNKLKQFEKEHGRVPSGDELIEIQAASAKEVSQKDSVPSAVVGVDPGDKPNPLEEELGQSRLQIESLQRQLEESSLKLAELAEARNTALEDAAAEHDAQLEAQKEQHQQQLDGLLESKDADTQQAVENALKEHGARIDGLVADHESKVADLAEKHTRELSALRDSNQQELKSLHDQVVSSSSAHDNELSRLTEELGSVNEQLIALQSQLAAETTSNQEELDKLRQVHQDELDSLTAQNMKSLEDANTDHARKLQDMIEVHHQQIKASAASAANIEELKASHKEELKSVSAQHTAKIEDLLSSHKKLLESINAKHADELEGLTSKYRDDLIKLRRDHQSEIEHLSSGSTALQDKFKALESDSATNLNRIAELESQLRASDNQITDFKVKLASADRESAEMIGQLAANHEQKLADLGAAHSAEVQELETRLETATTRSKEAKKRLVQAHSDEIASVKAQHQSILDELKRTNDAQFESLKATHKTEFEQVLSAGVKLSATKEAELNDLRSQLNTAKATAASQKSAIEEKYAAQLQEVREASSSTHNTELQRLQEEHGTRIKELDGHIAAAQQSLRAAEAKYAEQMQQANETASIAQEKAIEDIHNKHEAKLREIEDSHAQQLEHSRNELHSSHDQHLKALQETHDTKVRELSEKIRHLESSSNDVVAANARSDMLKAMFQNAERVKEDLQKEFEEKESRLNDEISKYVSKLAEMQQRVFTAETETKKAQKDLGGALAKAENAKASSKEIENLKERLQSASLSHETMETEVQELKSQLATADKQVAEGKAELAQLRATQTSATSEDQDAKQDSVTTRNTSGLAASKWASKGEHERGDSPRQAAPAPAALDPAAKSFSPTSLDPEVKEFEPSPLIPDFDGKKSNTAGQLAGIQHEIDHLREMSDEMLEENQSMAAKLNNVPGVGEI